MVTFLDGICLPGVGVTRAFFAIEVYFLVPVMVFEGCSSAKEDILVLVETGRTLAFVTRGRFDFLF